MVDADQQSTSAAQSPATGAFGVRVGGVRLLLPQGESLEYFAAATVYPLPLAGRRVRGMIQVRGHPVVVVDPGADAARGDAVLVRLPVLVIGQGSEAGAIRVDGAPEPLQAAEPAGASAGAGVPECGFRQSLHDGMVARGAGRTDEAAAMWWRFEPRRLFEALAGE